MQGGVDTISFSNVGGLLRVCRNNVGSHERWKEVFGAFGGE